jgi:radical SAM protein
MNWNVDFAQAPLLLIWETTRSCELACRHCRASAENLRHPDELTTDEGRRLLDDVKKMGTPLVILTGGDPLQRDDLEQLISHGGDIGLRVGTIPATTNRLTRERVFSLKNAGLHQMALSIDGASEAKHDDFRRVPGSFAKAMLGAQWAREAGLPLQVNTVFGSWNVRDFDAIASLVESLGIVFWEVFFLVPTGRGLGLDGCTPEQYEELFAKLHALSQRARFVVKITEAQHYRRYVAQHGGAHPGHGGHPSPRQMVSAKPVNSANGFCFVDHIGNIQPSGFLPITCGNVRQQSVIDVYRTHPTFVELRDPGRLKGRCAVCEFKTACGGGSRARAYAVTGDYFAEDPCCAYQPAAVLSKP